MRATAFVCVAIVLGAAPAARATDAKEIWSDQCAKCHGQDGQGHTAMGKKLKLKSLADPKVQAELKDEDIAKTIREGRKSPSGSTLMKPAENVTDDDVKGLVTFIRGFKA